MVDKWVTTKCNDTMRRCEQTVWVRIQEKKPLAKTHKINNRLHFKYKCVFISHFYYYIMHTINNGVMESTAEAASHLNEIYSLNNNISNMCIGCFWKICYFVGWLVWYVWKSQHFREHSYWVLNHDILSQKTKKIKDGSQKCKNSSSGQPQVH